jgi:tetratricopeptide (TPR) repeat protein
VSRSILWWVLLTMTFRPKPLQACLLASFSWSCVSPDPVVDPDLQQIALFNDLEVQRQDVALNPEDLALRLELAETLQALERPLEAAEQFEICAQMASPGQQRNFWQRASRQRELGGDLPKALADLRLALKGLQLKNSEQRLLERLQAFQNGDFEHPSDAVEVLKHHPDANFRYLAAQFLAQREFPAQAAVFADSLIDSDARIVALAARELSHRGSEMDMASLYPALDHAASVARCAATRCLGILGTTEAAGEILARLDPSDRTLFRLQRHALTRLTEHSVSPDLDPNLALRKIIAQAWMDWWQQRS